ncbi:hypothetical protein N7478_005882 [Penicillium angulare]|uniref:uncharacterized protein n=1 Tax=Penicillium angulare TaxID=116970 RepID=UPI0025411E8E|nr:uncharacterized protein N7478_005882 [Penicillium angulare]KAJ5280510.1 hypothetical protein N7478_005882 [Penicillium angulare]
MNRLRRHRPWNRSLFSLRSSHNSEDSKLTNKSSDSKLTHKSSADNSPGSEQWSDAIEDQRDGFYRYSETLINDAEEMLQMNNQKHYRDSEEGSEMSLEQRRHSSPYTVSSGEWVVALAHNPSSPSPYPSPRALSLDDLDAVEVSMHFGGVLRIFAQVYAFAKILQIIFVGFDVELDMSKRTGLMYWIEQAENQVRTDSLADLIEITENLFYAISARVDFEMAAVELCSLFNIPLRPTRIRDNKFFMPEPSHLYRLLLAIKIFLEHPSICENREEDLVTRFQEEYVRVLICKNSRLGAFIADDLLGFRRHIFSIASNPTSAFCQKWLARIPIFLEIPPQTITLLAEKYCRYIPKAWPVMDTPLAELPFANLAMIDPARRQKDIVESHRIGTLARLESKSIGEARREYQTFRLLHLVKHCACICESSCFCAVDCTILVHRLCPCAERQLRTLIALNRKTTGRFDFVTRVNTLAAVGFQGLATLRYDVSEDRILLELIDIWNLIGTEIQKERSTGPELNWLKL